MEKDINEVMNLIDRKIGGPVAAGFRQTGEQLLDRARAYPSHEAMMNKITTLGGEYLDDKARAEFSNAVDKARGRLDMEFLAAFQKCNDFRGIQNLYAWWCEDQTED